MIVYSNDKLSVRTICKIGNDSDNNNETMFIAKHHKFIFSTL